jgi:hypothetical protein
MRPTPLPSGTRFGKVVILEDRGAFEVEYRCDCGNVKVGRRGNLKNGGCKSCGRCKTITKSRYPREYKTWRSMKARCDNPKATGFFRYGGKGISYDPTWVDFEAFFQDMGERPDGCSLDRIDGSKGYSKENCRWATRKEQCNNRINNVRYTFEGLTLTVAQWARHKGIKHVTLKNRLNLGWGIEKALTKPLSMGRSGGREQAEQMLLSGKSVKEVAIYFGVGAESIGRIKRSLAKLQFTA